MIGATTNPSNDESQSVPEDVEICICEPEKTSTDQDEEDALVTETNPSLNFLDDCDYAPTDPCRCLCTLYLARIAFLMFLCLGCCGFRKTG